jgi:hypothetical protein
MRRGAHECAHHPAQQHLHARLPLPDFEVRQLDVMAVTADRFDDRDRLPAPIPAGIDVSGDQIFAEIVIRQKRAGIAVDPPWEPR